MELQFVKQEQVTDPFFCPPNFSGWKLKLEIKKWKEVVLLLNSFFFFFFFPFFLINLKLPRNVHEASSKDAKTYTLMQKRNKIKVWVARIFLWSIRGEKECSSRIFWWNLQFVKPRWGCRKPSHKCPRFNCVLFDFSNKKKGVLFDELNSHPT